MFLDVNELGVRKKGSCGWDGVERVGNGRDGVKGKTGIRLCGFGWFWYICNV